MRRILIANRLRTLGLYLFVLRFWSLWRMSLAAQTFPEVLSIVKQHLFQFQKVVGNFRDQVTRARLLMKQGLVDEGLEILASYAYGPNVQLWMRREALEAILIWALASNTAPLANAAANHLMGGFKTKTYRRATKVNAEFLLEHYSGEAMWSAPEGYAIFKNIKLNPSTQVLYAAANFAMGAPEEVLSKKVKRKLEIQWVNFILRISNLAEYKGESLSEELLTIDDLAGPNFGSAHVENGPLVTVIVPVFNGEKWLSTALDGLVNQTWRNLEILVVDDKSTDDTRKLVKTWAERDSRIHLIEQKQNGGSYVARNTALDSARGEFVTVHDADDWSHPAKIELQVKDLQQNAEVVANMSPGVRVVHESFHFYPVAGRTYEQKNYSSLMFRREAIQNEIGYWDEVRFGGDSEFMERIQARFGKNSVKQLAVGPVSFTRLHSASLTGGGYASLATGVSGIRQFYMDSFRAWHQQISAKKADAKLGRQSAGRPFAAPLLLTNRNAVLPKFDLVVYADLGPGSADVPVVLVELNKARSEQNFKLALIHRTRDQVNPTERVDDAIRSKLDFVNVSLLIHGDVANAKTVRVLHPESLTSLPTRRPELSAENVELLIQNGKDELPSLTAAAVKEFKGEVRWVRS